MFLLYQTDTTRLSMFPRALDGDSIAESFSIGTGSHYSLKSPLSLIFRSVAEK